MLVGYCLVSKADGSQSLDLQHDSRQKAGLAPIDIYQDHVSGKLERPFGYLYPLYDKDGERTVVVRA